MQRIDAAVVGMDAGHAVKFLQNRNPMKHFAAFLFFAALSLSVPAGESYDFLMISDLPLGPAETYNTAPGSKYRFKGDIRRTEKILPVCENMFRHMAEIADKKTRFLIQCGDLVDGLAKGEAEHRQQLNFAVGLLRKHFKMPIYHTMGNHDAHGSGGMAAARAVLLPEMARTLGKDRLDFANYTVAEGEDLFIFADFRRAAQGPQFIQNTLKALKKKPRYLFVVIHCPVIDLVKSDLADVLAKYDAVVLSGHLHRNLVIVYRGDGGSVTQVVGSSWLPINVTPKKAAIAATDLGAYKKIMAGQARKLGGDKASLMIGNWERELAPYLDKYIAIRNGGYLKIRVSDAGIRLECQGTDVKTRPVFIDLAAENKDSHQNNPRRSGRE